MKLESHLTGLREYEQSLTMRATAGPRPMVNAPKTIETIEANGDFPKIFDQYHDLVKLAFQLDLVRTATILYGHGNQAWNGIHGRAHGGGWRDNRRPHQDPDGAAGRLHQALLRGHRLRRLTADRQHGHDPVQRRGRAAQPQQRSLPGDRRQEPGHQGQPGAHATWAGPATTCSRRWHPSSAGRRPKASSATPPTPRAHCPSSSDVRDAGYSAWPAHTRRPVRLRFPEAYWPKVSFVQ